MRASLPPPPRTVHIFFGIRLLQSNLRLGFHLQVSAEPARLLQGGTGNGPYSFQDFLSDFLESWQKQQTWLRRKKAQAHSAVQQEQDAGYQGL